MSTARLRLLRLNVGKKPVAGPVSLRVLSPFGAGSILITSAPKSARIMPQLGPMTMCVNSITRMPASGVGHASESAEGATGMGVSMGRGSGVRVGSCGAGLGRGTVGTRHAGRRHAPMQPLIRQAGAQHLAGADQLGQVDACVVPLGLQEIDQVLG